MRVLCDRDDRIGWRVFLALESDCPCCTFWRGAALGVAFTLIVGAAVLVALHVIN